MMLRILPVFLLALSPCAAARQPERAPSSTPATVVPHYCDLHPDRCPCWQNPTGEKCACVDDLGRPCEAVPITGICCVLGGSPCHAVEFAAACPPELDFTLCDWGYETVDGNGQPTVECYDAQ